MKRRRAVLKSILSGTAFCLSLMLTAPAWAGEKAAYIKSSEANAVDLKEAVSAALRDNPEIKAKAWGLKAAEEDPAIAGSYLLPSLSLEHRYMRTDNPTYAFMAKLNEGRFTESDFAIKSLNNPEPVNDFQNSLKVEQVVFSKRALDGVKLASTETEAGRKDFERVKEKVARDTAAAYLGVLTAREYVEAARKGVADREEHRRLAQARYDAGMGLLSDVLRADAALKEAQRKLVEAQKGHDVAARALGLQMGRAEAVEALPVENGFTLEPIEAYYRGALSRADLKAMETRYQNSRNAIGLAKSSYWPEIGIGGQYQWNDRSSPVGGEGESYMASAFLRWNIFDGARREHEIKQARARSEEAKEGLEGMKKEIMFRVFGAYKNVEEARMGLDLAKAELASAEEGTRLVRVRYENSLVPIVDLLDAETMLQGARTRAAAAGNDLLMSHFNLAFESGRINEFINKTLTGETRDEK
jgi:outer membrane protein